MFLKNKNIIFKIRRSKVTDYAALNNYAYKNVAIYLHNKKIEYEPSIASNNYAYTYKCSYIFAQ